MVEESCRIQLPYIQPDGEDCVEDTVIVKAQAKSHVIPNTTPRVVVRRSTRATSRPQNYFSTEEANLTWAEALLLGDEKPKFVTESSKI